MTRRVSRILVGLLLVSATAGTPTAFAQVGRASPTPVTPAEIGGAHTSVINGLEAGHGTFPYMAFVRYQGEGEVDTCSGTVVSSNVILTAAHCVLNEARTAIKNPTNYTVTTGNVNVASPERVVSLVSRIATAPNLAYIISSGLIVRGDAAVLQLTAPITAPPVRLATSQVWGSGTAALMVGWGRTIATQQPPSTLHLGETAVQSNEFCAAHASHFESSSVLCTVDYPSYEWTTCNGDSGGPLLMTAPGTTNEPLEIGVTSYGVAECSTEEPAYFTRADAIAPWVNTKIAEYALAPASAPVSVPAPAPKVVPATVPKLPRLTSGAARSYMTKALLAGLGGRFRGRRAYTGRCREVNETKQNCGTTWTVGGTDFYGNVTIYYAFEAGKVVWNDRYTIHWVNDYCYFYSGHRSRCRIGTARR